MPNSSQHVQVTPEGAVTVFPIEEREPHALTSNTFPSQPPLPLSILCMLDMLVLTEVYMCRSRQRAQ
jgi:hypothetical protein